MNKTEPTYRCAKCKRSNPVRYIKFSWRHLKWRTLCCNARPVLMNAKVAT